jgi:hypothetical protein
MALTVNGEGITVPDFDAERQAKDKVEFDQFMNDRRNRPQQPPQTPPGDVPLGSPA